MHKDLKISLPRGAAGRTEYYQLVKKHGYSRKAMVAFICGIGGYSAGRGYGTFAIEFNVSADRANMNVENLWGYVVEEFTPESNVVGFLKTKELFEKAYNERVSDLWQWGIEEAFEGWKDSDTPYETFTGERVEWGWELHGRGGKHLCMRECAGLNLWRSNDELETLLNIPHGEYGYVDNARLRKLFIICVQNTVDLTPTKIGHEVEYRAAWRLYASYVDDEANKPLPTSTVSDALTQATYIKLFDVYGKDSPEVANFVEICRIANVTVTV